MEKSEKDWLVCTIFLTGLLGYMTYLLRRFFISKIGIKTLNQVYPRMLSHKILKLAEGENVSFNIHKENQIQKLNIQPTQKNQKWAGYAHRCEASFYNNMESLLYFAPALILSLIYVKNMEVILAFASIYFICRLLYLFCYIFTTTQGMSFFRCIFFLLGLFATIGLYLQVLVY